MDMNFAGNPPVSSTQGEPRTPPKKVNFEWGKNVDFFREFEIEQLNAGLGGEAVRERNRNWFKEVNSRWNVDWATGWGTAKTLNETPQQQAEIEARERRLSLQSYEVPIFRPRDQVQLKLARSLF